MIGWALSHHLMQNPEIDGNVNSNANAETKVVLSSER